MGFLGVHDILMISTSSISTTKPPKRKTGGPPPSADASSWSFAAPNVEPISCQKPVEKNDATFGFEDSCSYLRGG